MLATNSFPARLFFGLFALGAAAHGQAEPATRATESLRVSVVSAADLSEPFRSALATALARTIGRDATVTSALKNTDGKLALASLRSADAAVFVRGPGALVEGEVAELRRFIDSGRGMVVLGAEQALWAAAPKFLPEYLGAEPGGVFAKGAAMRVINLYPHFIYTGVATFETKEPMPLWKITDNDVQVIMEGTVGEDTAPLAWVRRRDTGRVCHIVPAGADFFRDAHYLQIVANAVLWTSGRLIPGAQPIVQRTFMPDSYPGSFAITFPNGPGVCFDPVRGGINFIWDGDFVDLRPRWLTKQGAPPRIFGAVFYRETVWQPQRLGAPSRDANFQFLGYALKAGAPEFRYQIAGRDVFETLEANAAGTELTRRFRVGAGAEPLWIKLEPQPDAEIALTGLVREGNNAKFVSSAAGEFAIAIRRKSTGARP